jgi:glycosyltransferase involved in cell wall biosynthesis
MQGPLGWSERTRAFRGASALIVSSRAEPFGMVILEAMQHRVPVLYADSAGAAEVLESGIRIDPMDAVQTAKQVYNLLGDLGRWEDVVQRQTLEVAQYTLRDYPDRVMAVWLASGKSRAIPSAISSAASFDGERRPA